MSDKNEDRSSKGAIFVAIGIFLSRILGLVRERVFAHFLGNSAAADAFKAAIRIPNLLQNLLGEGVLSASFIPTYSALLVQEKEWEAKRLALKVFQALALVVTGVSAIGVLLSPYLVGVIAPGFEGEKRELTIFLTRIFFPSTSLLVLSAWCLGISNSHHRFFLPYVAPVIWNLVMIFTLLLFGISQTGDQLAASAAWAAVVGSFLQFAIQIPQVWTLLSKLKGSAGDPNLVSSSFQKVLRSLAPVVFGRGVVQISAYADSMIASLLGGGAVSALSYAQTIYLLPVSLFGMSISAAELPGMSRLTGTQIGAERTVEEQSRIHKLLADRLHSGTKQIAFFVVPSAVAFLALGRELIGAAFQTGQFQSNDTLIVWYLLAALSFGLVPTTFARLTASTFYALHDTKTPVRCATIRVFVSLVLSLIFALWIPRLLNISGNLGLLGLGLASAVGATTEYFLLRSHLKSLLELPQGMGRHLRRVTMAAVLSAVIAQGLLQLLGMVFPLGAFLRGVTAAIGFGIAYLGFAAFLQLPELERVKRLFLKRYSPRA